MQKCFYLEFLFILLLFFYFLFKKNIFLNKKLNQI